MKFVKIFPKFQEHLLFMATSTLPQNFQESAITICSERFGCPSQGSLPKFKGHLFLLTALQFYHICRKRGESSSKFGRMEEASVNAWGSIGGRTS